MVERSSASKFLMKAGLSHPWSDLESRDRVEPYRRRRRIHILAVFLLLSIVAWTTGEVLYRSCSTRYRWLPKHADIPAAGLRNPAYLIEATHGAVASENEICSRIGVDVLKDGGNAVDATISAAFCIGVVNMFS